MAEIVVGEEAANSPCLNPQEVFALSNATLIWLIPQQRQGLFVVPQGSPAIFRVLLLQDMVVPDYYDSQKKKTCLDGSAEHRALSWNMRERQNGVADYPLPVVPGTVHWDMTKATKNLSLA